MNLLQGRMRKSEKFYKPVEDKTLNDVDLSNLTNLNEVSQVCTGLFIGGENPTAEESVMRSCGITHVLSIGHKPIGNHFTGIKYTFFEVDDVPEFPIRNIFSECTEIIDNEREANGAVYVHCKAGVSRSATVVIAYLMKKEKISYDEAYGKLKQARACIQPNDGFIRQLLEYERHL